MMRARQEISGDLEISSGQATRPWLLVPYGTCLTKDVREELGAGVAYV
jgi:hypothetical protein